MPFREPQYERCAEVPRVTLGLMCSQRWRDDPKMLGIVLARYKVVAKLLEGYERVAEIGCGDGFAGRVVEQAVGRLFKVDFDPVWCAESGAMCLDIAKERLDPPFDAIYALDVLEHIAEVDAALTNMAASLTDPGVLIVGMPSLESQPHASEQSRVGHVSCMSGDDLRGLLRRYFGTVFVFGMNDEMINLGYLKMAHYLVGLGVGVRR